MRNKLIAKDGYIFTNGDIYGTEIYLEDGMETTNFYEITLEEYQAMFEEQEV